MNGTEITPNPGSEDQAQPSVDVAALQKELDTLKSQAAEAQKATQFWYEKATAAGGGKGADKAADKPAESDEEVDVLDLAAKGGKEFDKYLNKWARKNGYVSRDEVESTVNTKAATLAKESELLENFPDLKDRKSEFFKATAEAYGELKRNGVPETMAMELAAKQVDRDWLRSGKAKTPQQQSEERKAQREQDRLARIQAQGSDRGGRRAADLDDEDDDSISPEEQRIISGMLVGQPGKDGKPMSYEQAVEAFKARAKAGVKVSRRSR